MNRAFHQDEICYYSRNNLDQFEYTYIYINEDPSIRVVILLVLLTKTF